MDKAMMIALARTSLLLLPSCLAVPVAPGDSQLPEQMFTKHWDPDRPSPNIQPSGLTAKESPSLPIHPTQMRISNNFNLSDSGYIWSDSMQEGVWHMTEKEKEEAARHRILDKGENVTYDLLLKDQPHGRSPGHPLLGDHPYPDFRNRLLCPDCKEMMHGLTTYCKMRMAKNANAPGSTLKWSGTGPRDDIEDFCYSNYLPANNNHKIGVHMVRDTHGSHAFTGTKWSECQFLVEIVKNHTCEPCMWLVNEPWNYGVPPHKQHDGAKEICFGPHAGVVKKVVGGKFVIDPVTGKEEFKPDEFVKCQSCVEKAKPTPTRHVHEECVKKPHVFEWEFCVNSVRKLEMYCMEHNPKKTPEDFYGFCDSTLPPMQYDSVIKYNECKDFLMAMMVHFHPANPCHILNGCPAQEICPVKLPNCAGELKGWTQNPEGNPLGPLFQQMQALNLSNMLDGMKFQGENISSLFERHR